MEVICSPKHRFELELKNTKSQKAPIKSKEFVYIYIYIYSDFLTEYRNDEIFVPKEKGKGISGVTFPTAPNMEIPW
jgi:hypothetical protein